MPSIAVNGIDLFYEVTGKGPPLLMIAGFSSDSQSWLPVVSPLASRYRLIMPDNRLVGRTSPKDVGTSIEQMAADCVALLDTLGIEQTNVLGHSMGGMVAMVLAEQWPQRVEKLVLSATQPTRSARSASLLDTLVSQHEAGIDEALWFRSLFHWLMPPPFFEDQAALDEAVRLASTYPYRPASAEMRRQADAIARFDFGDRAAGIQTPTLAILGRRDLLIPPEDSAAALQAIRGIRIVELAGAAHSVHWNDPDGFVAETLAFLSSP